jgi:N-acetylglucosaminyldiphosphoundecaprenol N-acetyl-beta-D-mannosaminyltransferase
MNPSSTHLAPPPRVNVLGVGISAVNMQQAVSLLDGLVQAADRKAYVCVAAAHSVLACRQDAELRRIFNRSLLTTPDGMPLVWISRLNGQRHVNRVYGPDLMLAVCERSLRTGQRHFFYGGAPGVPEHLVERLEARFPGLQVAGTFSPPYRPLDQAEEQALLQQISASRAQIVWVGLGTGKQEHWMAEHLGAVAAPLMIGVGAAFDFLSGRKAQAPPWMRRVGLEWLFRLFSDPRRLWRRYAAYPWFLVLLLAQLTKLKRFPLDD